jgi:hypothetical protein
MKMRHAGRIPRLYEAVTRGDDRAMRLSWLSWLLLLLVACGGSERAPSPAAEPAETSRGATTTQPSTESEPATVATSTADPLCLPIVHGCGCAYQCALGRRRPDGRYDVTHAGQDSRVDIAVLENRCFDADGRSLHDIDDLPEGARCLDVFYDQTPCGGECIPTTDYLDCRLDEGRCLPAP